MAESALSGEKNYAEGVRVSAAGFAYGSDLAAYVSRAAAEVYGNISELDGNIFVLMRSKTNMTEELIRELKARPDIALYS